MSGNFKSFLLSPRPRNHPALEAEDDAELKDLRVIMKLVSDDGFACLKTGIEVVVNVVDVMVVVEGI